MQYRQYSECAIGEPCIRRQSEKNGLVKRVFRRRGNMKGTSVRVHDRPCGETEAVLTYGSAARTVGMKCLVSTIFAELGGSALQNGLGSPAKPEFFRAFDAFVELLDQ